MQFHTQLFRHAPENGVWGDCMRTAFACLLDLPPSSVPHFNDGGPGVDEFNERVDAWLRPLNKTIFNIPYSGSSLQDVLTSFGAVNPDRYYFVSGCSPRGVDHIAIALNEDLIHDPHPDGGGLVGPCSDGYYWVSILAPLFHVKDPVQ